jgi:hypothetical protein
MIFAPVERIEQVIQLALEPVKRNGKAAVQKPERVRRQRRESERAEARSRQKQA